MKKTKFRISLFSVLLAVAAIAGHYCLDPWGYYWKVSPEEAALRQTVIDTAESWLGYRESDGSHQQIIDLYNTQERLPVGYAVQYTDSWCSTFVSAVSIQCGITEILPTECGCERHIGLFQELGRWTENDWAIPAPGDLIFYDWDQTHPGEAGGWSDHVGIVVGIKWPFLKVIEGNREDQVMYRILPLGETTIRGYAMPDYASVTEKTP